MALITINLTDNFTTLINKANDISSNIGDAGELITGDSNVVDALNSLKTLFDAFDDSAEIVNLARSSISVIDNGGDGGLSYNANTGQITYTGPSAGEVRAHFSAGVGLTLSEDGQFSIQNNAITNEMIRTNTLTSDRFSNRVTVRIKNKNGTIIKTIHSPGS